MATEDSLSWNWVSLYHHTQSRITSIQPRHETCYNSTITITHSSTTLFHREGYCSRRYFCLALIPAAGILQRENTCIRYGYWLVLSIFWYSVCFMFGFEYRVIHSMFYVWFWVSFETQYVSCTVSSYCLILDKFYITFQRCCNRLSGRWRESIG